MKRSMANVKKGDVVDYVESISATLSEPAEKAWHLVQVSDGLDSTTVEFLKRQKIGLYLPLIRIFKPVPRSKLSHSQRRSAFKPMREKIEPFFPGYAFINFSDAGERWREIFKMAHIRGLVCANNLPVQVSWKLIEEIQGKEIDGVVPAATRIAEFTFLIGEKVRVSDGPFASFGGTITELPKWMEQGKAATATLDDLDESSRVQLLVDIFGRETPVELSLDQIEKI